MKFQVKRIYEPKDAADGLRVLIDRLWPRGVSKEEAAIDFWPKDLTPSGHLRKDYHDGVLKYEEFAARYEEELEQVTIPQELTGVGKAVLLSAVKDVPRSHVPVLLAWLERKQKE